MSISFVEVAGANFRTDEKSDELNFVFMSRLGMGKRYLPARLAISRSLAISAPLEPLDEDLDGKTIKGDTLFGTGTTLSVWLALIVERAGNSDLDIKELVALVAAHWRRGLKHLDADWKHAGEDIAKFVERLVEVAGLPNEGRLRPSPGKDASQQLPEASPQERELLSDIADKTQNALQQMKFQVELLKSALTPNSVLLHFAGNAKMNVNQVLRKRSELLTTFGLNVVSVRPEPGAVALAIARPEREILHVETLWSQWHPKGGSWGNQELLVAVREENGSHLFLSPGQRHAPHTLIAGSTGSGKSVLMKNIILGIAKTNSSDQARITLIDPKQGVDYFVFENLPHLDGGIIDDQETAEQRLNELVEEMNHRYSRFKESKTSDLKTYNAKASPAERLPTIWLIHDEFAEWMLMEDYKKAVESTVKRLGVKARAAGIYLIFAAQRPDADVMPMQLRANLGNRLILKVDSEGTSEIALGGEKGAERLLGHGHLLAKLDGEQELCYAQVPLVDEGFAKKIVESAE